MPAKKTVIKFEVVGLTYWAYDGQQYFSGTPHEVEANKELATAIRDAAAAGVGVNILEDEEND